MESMKSKTILYLSYSAIFIAIITGFIFKINLLFLFIPAASVSYPLKLWALKKATLENQPPENIEAIKKDIKSAGWAFIALLLFAGIYVIFMYS